ncbi:MAG: hypothetical protein ABH813_02855 [Patescibacteria group bacterium]
MTTTLSETKLKSLIKESVKEVLEKELMKLRAFSLSEVSKKEQKDIERRYGSPSKKRGSKSYALEV